MDLMENEVLSSTKFLVENPNFVFINYSRIEEIARKFAQEKLPLPDWKMEIYPQEFSEEGIDFLFLESSINFAFMDFKTKQKFTTNYRGKDYKGAMGMSACLKRAWEEKIPIFEGKYLAEIKENEMKKIFFGNIEIPMLKERTEIFNEVGKVLSGEYGGRFHNFFEQHGKKLFNEKNGLIEKIILEFPSFDDSTIYQNQKVRFNKRAQLFTAVLHETFPEQKLFSQEELDNLTVFADYQLPKSLRDLGIINYEKSLAERVDLQKIIPAKSQEELEIRASTIHASQKLREEINKLREEKINALNLDYKLWGEGRKNPGFHHLTPTIAY